MAAETIEKKGGAPLPGRSGAVLIGSVLLMLTTTVPYLTLINAFLFAGIVFSGASGAWYYIFKNQVRLSYGEAFVLGAFCGIGGGILSVLASYLLLVFFDYRAGIESLRLLVDWGSRVAPEESGTFRELLKTVTAPIEITGTDLLASMIMTGLLYAPLAGLGGRITVFILKRQARRSRQAEGGA